MNLDIIDKIKLHKQKSKNEQKEWTLSINVQY